MKVPKINTKPFELFLDLDGVFAHFDRGVEKIFNKPVHEVPRKEMWKRINSHPDGFFYTLEMMPDADHLWAYTSQFDPTILSGLPSMRTGREQKVQWVNKHLIHPIGWSPEKIIVLPRVEKQFHSGPNKVLVDDHSENIEMWRSKGGIGVLHTDVWKTISDLEELRSQYK